MRAVPGESVEKPVPYLAISYGGMFELLDFPANYLHHLFEPDNLVRMLLLLRSEFLFESLNLPTEGLVNAFYGCESSCV